MSAESARSSQRTEAATEQRVSFVLWFHELKNVDRLGQLPGLSGQKRSYRKISGLELGVDARGAENRAWDSQYFSRERAFPVHALRPDALAGTDAASCPPVRPGRR
jgi:hypothetical protein